MELRDAPLSSFLSNLIGKTTEGDYYTTTISIVFERKKSGSNFSGNYYESRDSTVTFSPKWIKRRAWPAYEVSVPTCGCYVLQEKLEKWCYYKEFWCLSRNVRFRVSWNSNENEDSCETRAGNEARAKGYAPYHLWEMSYPICSHRQKNLM